MSSHQHGELARLKQPDEIDEVFGRAHPNPERVGCPSRDVLLALARRERPIGDPAYGHLAECSPCYLEVRALKDAADLSRRRMLTWASAAVVALAAGAGAWILMTRSGSVDTELQAQLDLRPYAIMRGEAPTTERPPLELPRGRVMLTLLLPTASEPGLYELEIRDTGGTPKASARGDAKLRNQLTTLDVAVATGALSPGAYRLAVRHAGDGWQEFPLRVE